MDCTQPVRVRASLVTGLSHGTVADVEITCPRCQSNEEARFYGPCESCREQLRDLFRIEGRVIELAEYEPKMNVTPNAVAVKD